MDLLAAWVLFPVAVVAVSLGLGLLGERAAGRRLPGPLLVVTGFVSILALANLLTYKGALAPLALPVLVLLAVAGYLVGLERVRDRRPDRWAAVAAIGVFLSLGGPAYLTGQPTFSGSLLLPDTSNQLILADHLADRGRDYAAPPRSSYEASANKYLASQYPVAAQAALGVLAPLGIKSSIWLYQPYLALLAAMAALAIFALVRPWVQQPWLRGTAAFLSAQPALAYSFAQQGSIKEVAAITGISVSAALVAELVREKASTRAFLLPALAFAATFGALGPAAMAYAGPLALVLGTAWVIGLHRTTRRNELLWGAAVLIAGAVLLVPLLAGVSTAYKANSAVLSMAADLGNLAAPLNIGQVAGVWWGTDFRYPAHSLLATYALIGIVLLSAAWGLVWMVRRRAVGPLVYVVPLTVVSIYLLHRGSPYADAKVMVLLAPVLVFAAVLGAVSLYQARRIAEALVLIFVLGAGVLGSNALAYHGVQRAPYHRYEELLDIDDRFAGQGPALLNEYDEYAGYLLKDVRGKAEPESPLGYRDHDPARTPDGLVDPRHRPSVKTPLDVDDLTGAYVQTLPLLILRHSPTMSRPPANFVPVYRGRYYDVWRRRARPRVRAHLPLGADIFAPSGPPRCAQVRRLAQRARKLGGRLATVVRPALSLSDPLRRDLPRGWFSYAGYPRSVVPRGAGVVTRAVHLPADGRYRLWLEGSFGRAVAVEIDGRRVGSVAYEAGNPGQYFPVTDLPLSSGRHVVRIVREGGDLRPGNGGGAQASLRHIGPLVFSPEPNERLRVRILRPSAARELCGRRLDWIEVVTGR